jgi:hypothetical protein
MSIEENEIADLTPEERAEIESELSAFAEEETVRLGLGREQWVEPVHSR